MDASKGVIVELSSGARYGLKDAESAARIYPNAKIVSFDDGTPYVGSEPVEVDTSKMTRDELNDYAAKLGVENPAGLGSKADVVKAIENA